MIKYTGRDTFQPGDRTKYYFPEGTFIVVGFFACFFGILLTVSGGFGADKDYIMAGVGLLVFAFMLFALKGIVGALYDIREYQARRAKWVDNESIDRG